MNSPALLAALCLLASGLLSPAAEIVATTSLPAPEAKQAAAADEQFVYAIGNQSIAKYDRATGRRLAVSTGPAHHLNSGFLWQGRLYCAHSNYPKMPEQSELMSLDPEIMRLTVAHEFGPGHGSLTWAVREGDAWWCTFAHYGAENAQTLLVKYDGEWRELGQWTYPPAVIADLGKMSISGGLWRKGELLATGHDKRVLYRLRVPERSGVLELIAILASPFPGQGIATDPKTGGLVGIDKYQHEVIFADWRE